jgi:hypothetical protein
METKQVQKSEVAPVAKKTVVAQNTAKAEKLIKKTEPIAPTGKAVEGKATKPADTPAVKPARLRPLTVVVDEIILAGGKWDDMIAEANKAAAERKLPVVTKAYILGVIKYRAAHNDARYIDKLTVTDAGITVKTVKAAKAPKAVKPIEPVEAVTPEVNEQ